MQRPIEIDVKWLDPWDGALVCASRVAYDPRRAAKGLYSKWIRRVTANAGRFASMTLQDRTPRTRISFIF